MLFKKRRNSYFTILTLIVFAAIGYNAQAERTDREVNKWSNVRSDYQRSTRRELNGTWQLDSSRSDNVNQAVDRAVRGLSPDEKQRLDRMLTRRLSAPETIAIEQQGPRFTIASSRGRQISFDANGRTRSETSLGGRPVRVNASLNRNELIISSTGDRGHDYRVTFDVIDGGQKLRVTRQIYSDRLRQPVTVVSVYDKSSDVAQLDLYRGGMNYRYSNDRSNGSDRARDSFAVPNGTPLVAVLNQDLDTKTVHEGEPISLVVRSPRQFENAVLEGTITNVERSGRVSGRAGISFDFDRMRLPNGETYRFAGYVESIRVPGGENVRVDNEGSVREEDSQTKRTVTRTGIGAALGAVVGAIAGGGKGAAIGAAIGGGAGAGSVFIQGRNDLELRSGTEFTIRSVTLRDAEARR